MKAIIKDGRIIKTNAGTVEIGRIPKGSTISEMYWTGSALVDLTTLSEFYVLYIDFINVIMYNIWHEQRILFSSSKA